METTLWLTNPDNPAMSPHKETRKTANRHTDKTVEREGGIREGKQPLRRVPTLKTLTLNENANSTQNYYNVLLSKNTLNLGTCTDLNAVKASFGLLVVTCVTPLNCIFKLLLKKGYHLERHQSCTASIQP